MKLKNSKCVRLSRYSFLERFRILVEYRLAAGDYLCDDREPIASGCLWEDGTVAALLDLVLEETAFRDRHGSRPGPIALLRCRNRCWRRCLGSGRGLFFVFF